jgi:hypothetical protein
MIPRDDIVAGIAHTPLVAPLSEIEEIKPSPRLRPLFNFLTELGLLQRKATNTKKFNSPPSRMTYLHWPRPSQKFSTSGVSISHSR